VLRDLPSPWLPSGSPPQATAEPRARRRPVPGRSGDRASSRPVAGVGVGSRWPIARAWLSGGDVAWLVAVAVVYVGATVLAAIAFGPKPDRMLVLAERILAGHLDAPAFAGTADSVTIAGRSYMVVEPLLPLSYIPFAVIPALRATSGYLLSGALGIGASWIALPLARAWGATGRAAYWVAALTAFGTLLFYLSVFGDFYYTAQVEAFLALAVFLLEWAGRRRPLVLGALLAVAVLARTPIILAAIPFGLALIGRRPLDLRRGVIFAVPLVVAGAVYAAYDVARFGSPFETGYAISTLTDASLAARRAQGLFSFGQLAENVRLALLAGFQVRGTAPFLVPSPYGLSMLLVSPGLLIAVRAGFRMRSARLLWAAVGLVAIPIFLYYGGGYVQYGFRYSLDFTPFLLALVALGLARGAGRLDRALILMSIVSVTYGVLWHAHLLRI
jgi:hypothetical protein